jgi:signal transduction histidine kinase/ABC-type amino acid transport substrate-binding protein
MVDVAFSEARAAEFDFSAETVLINWGVLYTRAGFQVSSPRDLAGKRVAVMAGSIHTEGPEGILALLRQFSVNADITYVENYNQVFQLLDQGKADAGVVNTIFGALYQKDYAVTKSPLAFNPSELRFAFPKNAPRNTELIATLDRRLAALKADSGSMLYGVIGQYLSGRAQAEAVAGGAGRAVALTPEERRWIAEHPVIRYAVDPGFIPYEFLDEKGEHRGISSDYVRLLSERLGITMQRVPTEGWNQAVELAKQGKIDVLPCVGRSAEREASFSFSKPYARFQRVIITSTRMHFITGLEDVESLRVAVQMNSSHHGFLAQHTTINPLLFKDLPEALEAVSEGKADALVGNLATCTYWIRKLNLTNLKIAAPVGNDSEYLHFAVRKDWPELLALINKGLDTVDKFEENAILKNWVAVEYDSGINIRTVRAYALWSAGLAALVFGAIFLWNFKLKKEIIQRKAAQDSLQRRVEFEHLVSELSSNLIAAAVDEIDGLIDNALERIVYLAGADIGYVYRFERNGAAALSHAWCSPAVEGGGASLRNGVEAGLSDRVRRLKSGSVVKVADLRGLAEETRAEYGRLVDLGAVSLLEVPRSYGRRAVGFLGLCSVSGPREWTGEEAALLQLVGQIITNALMRCENEEALTAAAGELHAANVRLQELDRLKSMFIATMSHELRTPLNSIIGFTGVLLQGMSGELNERQRDQLGRVYHSANHLLSLITDIIDISKIEAGRVDVVPENFSLQALVAEAVAAVEQQAEAKGLELVVDIPEETVLLTDRKRLLQCLLNFLSNAVKYSEAGRIQVTARDLGEELELLVRDSGIGISDADKPKLFEAFERFDSTLKVKAGGTGLGLYLTRKIVTDLLCGKVLFESRQGQGSTFGVRIPKELAPGTCVDFSERREDRA